MKKWDTLYRGFNLRLQAPLQKGNLGVWRFEVSIWWRDPLSHKPVQIREEKPFSAVVEFPPPYHNFFITLNYYNNQLINAIVIHILRFLQ